MMLRITSVEMTESSLGFFSERSAEGKPLSERKPTGGH